MIDPKEIRNGSIIRHIDSGEKTVLYIKSHLDGWMVVTESDWCYLKNCVAIPIDNDILTIYGWKKAGDKKYEYRTSFHSFVLTLTDTGATITNPFTIRLHYFHQLQNIIFDLSGRDMMYNG